MQMHLKLSKQETQELKALVGRFEETASAIVRRLISKEYARQDQMKAFETTEEDEEEVEKNPFEF